MVNVSVIPDDALSVAVVADSIDTSILSEEILEIGIVPETTLDVKTIDISTIRGEKGDPGKAATIQVGTVSTAPLGMGPSITNSGTPSAAIFDFVLPSGSGGGDIQVATDEEVDEMLEDIFG